MERILIYGGLVTYVVGVVAIGTAKEQRTQFLSMGLVSLGASIMASGITVSVMKKNMNPKE